MEVSHPTITGIVSRLENNGFLVCNQAPEDRRNKIVTLTSKAISVCDDMERMVDTAENEMLKGLSENQIKDLQNVLEIIYNNLND